MQPAAERRDGRAIELATALARKLGGELGIEVEPVRPGEPRTAPVAVHVGRWRRSDRERLWRATSKVAVAATPTAEGEPDDGTLFDERWRRELGHHVLRILERRPRPVEPDSAPIRVFVGSEPRMWAAEAVLLHSLRDRSSRPIELTRMRYDLGGPWAGWEMGRPPGTPARTSTSADGPAVWFTDFSNFRWAIPELCGFRGRAIYLDVDVVVTGDPAELWELPATAPVTALTPRETSVMLLDCARFATLDGWPRLAEMRDSGRSIGSYLELLARADALAPLPPEWNSLDGDGFSAGDTRLVHFTDMATQPWRPYPDRIAYRPHPRPWVESLWFECAERARAAGAFDDSRHRTVTALA